MSLLFFGVLLFGFVLRYLQNYLLSVLGQRVMYLLRSNMFEHLQQLSLAFFDHNPVGRLMTRITNDVDSLNDLFTSGAVNLIADLFTLAGIVVIPLFRSWELAVIGFGLIPPLLLANAYFQRAIRDNFPAIRLRLARLHATIA